MPSHAPARDRRAVEALKCTPEWDGGRWQLKPGDYTTHSVDERLSEFQRNWEAVIREWSNRWGDDVSAWWVDKCYYANVMYRHPDEPNFAGFAAAARAGNPTLCRRALSARRPSTQAPPSLLSRLTAHSAKGSYLLGGVTPCVTSRLR